VAGSLIYVGTHAITHGKLDIAKQASRDMGAFLEATTKIDIYGRPSDALVDQIRQMGMGAPIRFNVATGGFSRLASVGV
jgi:hypothetical protein